MNVPAAVELALSCVALSGVPAYISCPEYLEAIGGALGEEARRRLAVVARLDYAPDLEALREIMRAEGITYYVVTTARDAPFDAARRQAIGHVGVYAVYAASSAG